MRQKSICGVRVLFGASLLLSALFVTAPLPGGARGQTTISPAAFETAMAEYRRKLADYLAAREQFDAAATVYWRGVAEKRRSRDSKRRNHETVLLDDYVLTQPPLYSGPPKPVDPSVPVAPPNPRAYVPVVADFLNAAAQYFDFVPERPQSELDYKRAYAGVAQASGLTIDQIVRIYAFESGGNGKYDVQAGLEYSRPDARAISTALGYNQLLTTNSVELIAEQGEGFVKELKIKAARLPGNARAALTAKIEALQRMTKFARSVPDSWGEHERLANTAKGLGLHAMVLDIDVGPLLQTQKLLDSIVFAHRKGYERPLSAAELEMMNLTGDSTGLDMVAMPPEMRMQVPTANFFQRSGYERNPVAIRNNVVSKLLAATDAKMDGEIKLQGAKDLAAAYPH